MRVHCLVSLVSPEHLSVTLIDLTVMAHHILEPKHFPIGSAFVGPKSTATHHPVVDTFFHMAGTTLQGYILEQFRQTSTLAGKKAKMHVLDPLIYYGLKFMNMNTI